MADFVANVSAVLDTSKIPEQLKDIGNKQIIFTNLKFDTTNLIANLQEEISKYDLNLNVGNINTQDVSNQMRKNGKQAGDSFADGVAEATAKLKNNKSNMFGMDNLTSGINLQKKVASEFLKQLDNANIKVTRLRTSMPHDGNIRLNATGIDEIGRVVTLVKEYDSASGIMNTISSGVTQAFNSNGEAVARAEEKVKNFGATAEATSLKSSKLKSDMSSWGKNNPKALNVFGAQLEKIKEGLTSNEDPEYLKKANLLFSKIKAQAKEAGLTTRSFTQSLKNAVLQLSGLASTYTILQKAVDVGKKMYQNVCDIDAAMTNLYKVTDETDRRYNSFLSSSISSAKELGRSVSSLIEQSATWAKLGFNIDESEQLAKVSSIYANTGEVDDATAVSDLVTVMKSFNLAASESMSIVDSLNELGNSYATSSAALGEGLTRSASSMKLSGASMNETLAMLTGITEITQNAPEAGNALKIFAMRVTILPLDNYIG